MDNTEKGGESLGKKPKSKVIRPLGYLERYEAALHSLDLYRSTMLTCQYAIPTALLSGQDPKSQAKLEHKVESAIARIVLEHPFMRVGLRGEHSRKPAFVELEAVDFRRHIEWRRLEGAAVAAFETELPSLIVSHLDTKVEQPEDAPAWRILILHFEKDNKSLLDVMLEIGHAHLDGMSAKIFHEDLLRYLNDSDSNDSGPEGFVNRVLTIPPTKRRDLTPSQEALYKFPLKKRYVLGAIWTQFKPSASLSAHWAPFLSTGMVTHYRQFSIDNATLQNILSACRRHKTTLTGLLNAIGHASLATRVPVEKARGFLGSTIINLRLLMRAAESKTLRQSRIDPDRTMANFITQVHHEYGVEWVAKIRAASANTGEESQGKDGNEPENGKEDENRRIALEPLVWAAAERVRADVQMRLDEKVEGDEMGLMKLVPDYRIFLKDRVKGPRAESLVVTNLGVIDGDGSPSGNIIDGDGAAERSGKWTIERAIFSLSAEAPGAAFIVSPVAVRGKELYVGFTWQDRVIDQAVGEGVVTDLEAWLKALGQGA